VLITNECNNVASTIQECLAVAATSKVIGKPGFQVGLDVVIYIIGEPPPYFEATDLDDHIVVRHGRWPPFPDIGIP
jgi:hypothetical protein